MARGTDPLPEGIELIDAGAGDPPVEPAEPAAATRTPWWTWLAVAGTLPPGWPFLLPLAALAGPALHLANSLVDVDSDARADRSSLATQLGARRAKVALTIMVAIILVLAWSTLSSVGASSGTGRAAAIVATVATTLGVALSWQDVPRAREAGWLLQAECLSPVVLCLLCSAHIQSGRVIVAASTQFAPVRNQAAAAARHQEAHVQLQQRSSFFLLQAAASG